jgi:stage IV sporulation protein A
VEAAEMGTHKVITEHSTIGMLVTTDGSIGDISRQSYVEAEERIVGELKEMGKPFAVVLNSAHPQSEESIALAYELESKYEVPVALVSCIDLDAEDIRHILELVLHEFPVCEMRISMPEWTQALDDDHSIKASVLASIKSCADKITRAGDIKTAFNYFDNEYVKNLQHELHRVPELGFDLPKTTAIVKRELDKIGIGYTEKYGKSSIVAELNSEKANFTIAIRADMDALPIRE